MQHNELIQLINTQTTAGLAENITMNQLQEKLSEFINDLIQHNFQQLITILYNVDVDETKLKEILKETLGKDAGSIIAGLIIERQLKKLATRKKV